jgi:hypothetical protein
MGLEPTTFCMANASERSGPFARVRSTRLFAGASVRSSERERTRANAEPCHSCHGSQASDQAAPGLTRMRGRPWPRISMHSREADMSRSQLALRNPLKRFGHTCHLGGRGLRPRRSCGELTVASGAWRRVHVGARARHRSARFEPHRRRSPAVRGRGRPAGRPRQALRAPLGDGDRRRSALPSRRARLRPLRGSLAAAAADVACKNRRAVATRRPPREFVGHCAAR